MSVEHSMRWQHHRPPAARHWCLDGTAPGWVEDCPICHHDKSKGD